MEVRPRRIFRLYVLVVCLSTFETCSILFLTLPCWRQCVQDYGTTSVPQSIPRNVSDPSKSARNSNSLLLRVLHIAKNLCLYVPFRTEHTVPCLFPPTTRSKRTMWGSRTYERQLLRIITIITIITCYRPKNRSSDSVWRPVFGGGL